MHELVKSNTSSNEKQDCSHMGIWSTKEKGTRNEERWRDKVVVKKRGWNDSKLSRQCVYDRRYDYMSE